MSDIKNFQRENVYHCPEHNGGSCSSALIETWAFFTMAPGDSGPPMMAVSWLWASNIGNYSSLPYVV